MRRISFPLAVALALLVTRSALARIEASFHAESSARCATDIVVAKSGEKIDGSLEVLETWKGTLKKGDKIKVPELAEFENEGARAIYAGFGWGKEDDKPREHVTGSRMVLFLIRTGGVSAETATWAPAHSWTERSQPSSHRYLMRVSIAWIEHGDAHAFVQIMNPGDPVLIKIGTEGELRAKADKAIGMTEAFLKARAIEDRLERAKALEPLTSSESPYEAAAAFDAIAACGSRALPVLKGLIENETLLARRSLAVQAFTEAGGLEAGPELTKMLDLELAYWKKAAATASWDANSEARNHYEADLALLEGLKKLRYQGCKTSVTEFQEAWRTLHRFAHESWFDHLIGICGSVLLALDEPAKPAPPASEPSTAPGTPAPVAVPEVPLTTDDDARRVRELEDDLAKELERLRAMPETRRAVIGRKASDGEVRAELARVLEKATPVPYQDWRAFCDQLGSVWPADPIPLGEKLEAPRAHLSANVGLVETLLAAERIGNVEVEGEWRNLVTPHSWTGHVEGIDGIRLSLMLESLHALEKGDAARSVRLAVDLWRFDHDVRREERLLDYRRRSDYSGDASRLIATAIPSLDEGALKNLDSELALLATTLPAFSSEVERRRLALGCFFRAYEKGELRPVRSDDLDGRRNADPTPIGHLDPRAQLTNRRVGAIRREWETLDRVLRYVVDVTARFERPSPLLRGALHSVYPTSSTSPESWDSFLREEADRFLGDVAALRIMRVLVGAQRFRLANGRWPKDQDEAVGSELAKALTNPLDGGKPFDLEILPEAKLRIALAMPEGSKETRRLYALVPRSK